MLMEKGNTETKSRHVVPTDVVSMLYGSPDLSNVNSSYEIQIDPKMFKLRASDDEISSKADALSSLREHATKYDLNLPLVEDNSEEPVVLSTWQQLRADIGKKDKGKNGLHTGLQKALEFDNLFPTKAKLSEPEDIGMFLLNDNKYKIEEKVQPKESVNTKLYDAETEKKKLAEKHKLQKEVLENQRLVEEQKKQLLELQRQAQEEKKNLKAIERQKEDFAKLKKQQEIVAKQNEVQLEKMRMGILAEYEGTKHLRIKKKIFGTWLRKSTNRIMLMKKLDAQWKWKLKSKSFHYWKSFVQEQRMIREQKQIEKELRDEKLRTEAAEKFCREKTLITFFMKWHCLFKIAQENAAIQKQQEARKLKMESLMERLRSQQQPEPEPPVVIPEVKAPVPVKRPKLRPPKAPISNAREALPTMPELPTHLRSSLTLERSTVEPRQENNVVTEVAPPQQNDPVVEHIEVEPNPSTEAESKQEKKPVKEAAFLKTMEQRSKERKERRDRLAQKYMEIEVEKERKRLEEEQKAIEEEQERKRQVVEEKKRERLAQQQKLLEKEQAEQEARDKWQKAKEHYHKTIQKNLIWLPLKRNMEAAREEIRRACYVYERNLSKKVIKKWKIVHHEHVQARLAARERVIVKMERKADKRLMQYIFDKLKENRIESLQKQESINQYFATKTISKCIVKWRRVLLEKQRRDEIKRLEMETIADEFVIGFRKRFFFSLWKDSVKKAKEKREMENIGAQLRARSQRLLSEYRITQGLTNWNID
jgi:hypothetical protein